MKHFLRDGGQVEFIREDGWYWKSGHWQKEGQRSTLAALLVASGLTEEEMAEMNLSPGVWLVTNQDL